MNVIAKKAVLILIIYGQKIPFSKVIFHLKITY